MLIEINEDLLAVFLLRILIMNRKLILIHQQQKVLEKILKVKVGIQNKL